MWRIPVWEGQICNRNILFFMFFFLDGRTIYTDSNKPVEYNTLANYTSLNNNFKRYAVTAECQLMAFWEIKFYVSASKLLIIHV